MTGTRSRENGFKHMHLWADFMMEPCSQRLDGWKLYVPRILQFYADCRYSIGKIRIETVVLGSSTTAQANLDPLWTEIV